MKTLKPTSFIQKFQIWLERHSMYILWQNIQLTELPVINSKGKKTQKESTSWNLRWVVTSKNSCAWALVPVTLAVNRLRLSKQLHYAFMKECALPKYAACWLHATLSDVCEIVTNTLGCPSYAVQSMPPSQFLFSQSFLCMVKQFTLIY